MPARLAPAVLIYGFRFMFGFQVLLSGYDLAGSTLAVVARPAYARLFYLWLSIYVLGSGFALRFVFQALDFRFQIQAFFYGRNNTCRCA